MCQVQRFVRAITNATRQEKLPPRVRSALRLLLVSRANAAPLSPYEHALARALGGLFSSEPGADDKVASLAGVVLRGGRS